MAVSFAEMLDRHAARMPDRVALICEDRQTTWSELWQRCQAIAGGLCKLGLEKGDRVAFLGLNSDWFYEGYFAPSFMGGESVALNYRLSVNELSDCMTDSAAKVLIVDPARLTMARQICARLGGSVILIVIGTEPEGKEISYEKMIAAAHSIDQKIGAGDDTLIIYYSGGTTGRAKGVMLSHWNLFANSTGHAQVYDVCSEETHLLTGPMFHLGAGARVFCSVYAGCTMVIQPKFTPLGFLQIIQQHQVNATMFIPAMMQMVLDLPEFGDFDLSSLRQMSFGASPASEELLRRIVAAFPQVAISHGYGMTEASPVLAALGPEYHRADFAEKGKLGAVGRPVPHCDLRIFDANDQELPVGEIGEIVARGPNVMKGYLNQPELTAETLRGGWLHTGDAGYFDEDGILWISGRIKDMIISGGENIYPGEVENILSIHDQVAEVAVIGIPNDKWGEAVHAIVIPAAGTAPDPAELVAYCRANLATYKCPQTISFRHEPWPLSGANKILKTELRKPFWGS
ncbi:AMP-binding protein [uncultured Shimia sp.]|uniref:class I adenylate-forming enzyme family protein n=1 Tax=uncultured Shimia sp. TaxID=573152 RepID=UPI0025F25132|nr:AMP-binding protein [uncultured Shimia sp.]